MLAVCVNMLGAPRRTGNYKDADETQIPSDSNGVTLLVDNL